MIYSSDGFLFTSVEKRFIPTFENVKRTHSKACKMKIEKLSELFCFLSEAAVV